MPGYVADIIPRLRQSDLFVLSSDYEGLPAVIVEALACDIPVATTESFFAARDLRQAGLRVLLVEDASAGIDVPAAGLFQAKAKDEGRRLGIEYVTAAEVAAVAR